MKQQPIDHCNLYINSNKTFTCVDNLDASVISKLPFKPRREGTNMKISETFVNTSQCWNRQYETYISYTLYNKHCTLKMI